MPYRVTCNQCGASVVTGDGNSDRLACGCCPQPHSHEAAANACPGAGGNHPGAACPHGENSAELCHVTPPGVPCPGGHCGPGVDGCTVCRPATIEFLGG